MLPHHVDSLRVQGSHVGSMIQFLDITRYSHVPPPVLRYRILTSTNWNPQNSRMKPDLPTGSVVVPFFSSYLGSDKGNPKKELPWSLWVTHYDPIDNLNPAETLSYEHSKRDATPQNLHRSTTKKAKSYRPYLGFGV